MPREEKPAYYSGHYLDRALGDRYLRLLEQRYPLLELGCGAVGLTEHPSARGLIVGVDHDLGALRRRKGPGILLDLESGRLPFRDRCIGSVLAKDILEHVQRPWLVLREVARILAPEGTLLVSVPMARPSRVWEDYTHIRGFTVRSIHNLLKDTGFSVTRTAVMGGIPLTGKLGLADWIPTLMHIPPVRWVYGRSYEVVARSAR